MVDLRGVEPHAARRGARTVPGDGGGVPAHDRLTAATLQALVEAAAAIGRSSQSTISSYARVSAPIVWMALSAMTVDCSRVNGRLSSSSSSSSRCPGSSSAWCATSETRSRRTPSVTVDPRSAEATVDNPPARRCSRATQPDGSETSSSTVRRREPRRRAPAVARARSRGRFRHFEVVQEPLVVVHLFRDVRFEVAGECRADIIVSQHFGPLAGRFHQRDARPDDAVRGEKEFWIELRDPRMVDDSRPHVEECRKQDVDLSAQALARSPPSRWRFPCAGGQRCATVPYPVSTDKRAATIVSCMRARRRSSS